MPLLVLMCLFGFVGVLYAYYWGGECAHGCDEAAESNLESGYGQIEAAVALGCNDCVEIDPNIYVFQPYSVTAIDLSWSCAPLQYGSFVSERFEQWDSDGTQESAESYTALTLSAVISGQAYPIAYIYRSEDFNGNVTYNSSWIASEWLGSCNIQMHGN